jgi:hypothetical protein
MRTGTKLFITSIIASAVAGTSWYARQTSVPPPKYRWTQEELKRFARADRQAAQLQHTIEDRLSEGDIEAARDAAQELFALPDKDRTHMDYAMAVLDYSHSSVERGISARLVRVSRTSTVTLDVGPLTTHELALLQDQAAQYGASIRPTTRIRPRDLYEFIRVYERRLAVVRPDLIKRIKISSWESQLAGATFPPELIILNSETAADAFDHEFGHGVDYWLARNDKLLCDWASLNPEGKEFYLPGASRFGLHGLSSPAEERANLFARLLDNPCSLKQRVQENPVLRKKIDILRREGSQYGSGLFRSHFPQFCDDYWKD